MKDREISFDNSAFSYCEYKNYDSANNKFRKHMHYTYEILFFWEGNVTYVIEDKTYFVKKGDMLLIKPNKYHFVKEITAAPYCRFCMLFPQKSVDEQLLNSVYENTERITFENGSDVEKLFHIFYNSIEEEDQESIKTLYNCFLKIILLNIKKSSYTHKTLNAHIDTNGYNLINYISENFTKINKIEDISKAIFLSPSFINHYFKKNLDISCMQFIRKKKIFHAHYLIENGQKPTDVYLECGFSNYVTFYRQYLSVFGYCPHKTSK